MKIEDGDLQRPASSNNSPRSLRERHRTRLPPHRRFGDDAHIISGARKGLTAAHLLSLATAQVLNTRCLIDEAFPLDACDRLLCLRCEPASGRYAHSPGGMKRDPGSVACLGLPHPLSWGRPVIALF
ncbi:MAG: hypothetical protein AAF488_16585, partial [Planctomycetota bacterium]